jgi:hypothetical protein
MKALAHPEEPLDFLFRKLERPSTTSFGKMALIQLAVEFEIDSLILVRQGAEQSQRRHGIRGK